MYSGSSADIRLIDINRPSNIVVFKRNDESFESDRNGLYHRKFGYTNNGYKITFLYNEGFTNKEILHHERMSESEIEAIKQEYDEVTQLREKTFGVQPNYFQNDEVARRYNFDD